MLAGITIGPLTTAAAQATAPSDSVQRIRLDDSRVTEITNTPEGRQQTTSFKQRIDTNAGFSAGDVNSVKADTFKVFAVELPSITPAMAARGNNKMTLVAPADIPLSDMTLVVSSGDKSPVTAEPRVKGTSGSIWTDLQVNAKPPAVDSGERADIGSQIAADTYPYTYYHKCFARQYAPGWGDWVWFDHCWDFTIQKYDGNSNWNYYSMHQFGTCKSEVSTPILACGLGGQRNGGGTISGWYGWAPKKDETSNCRSLSISVPLYGGLSMGGSYEHCETNDMNKYTEPAKFSHYWRGPVSQSDRSVEYQVSWYVPQGGAGATFGLWSPLEIPDPPTS
ncbi:hypothetical protein [Nonomuraea sp. NPDC050691]|uniref:hypothetical protein n=1 Tax=Nonomuraea sp. NPDC050691 TaxID=3155661 RepID=UPI00340412EC